MNKLKYDLWPQRLFTSLAGYMLHLFLCVSVCDIISPQISELVTSTTPPSYFFPIIGSSLITYLFVAFALRFFDAGSFVLLELMWFCNLALFEAGYGMLTGRPLLVAASLVTVLTDQLCWYVDCISYLFTRRFVIGAAKYLTWPTISFARKVTSFHHLWFFPVCFYTLGFHLPAYSWHVSCVFTLTGLVYCRFFTPLSASDGVQIHYLNINGAYEFWKDVPIALLHRWNHPKSSALCYLTFLFLFGNTVNLILSGVFYVC